LARAVRKPRLDVFQPSEPTTCTPSSSERSRWQNVASSLPSSTRYVRASVRGEAPSFFTWVASASVWRAVWIAFGASQGPRALSPAWGGEVTRDRTPLSRCYGRSLSVGFRARHDARPSYGLEGTPLHRGNGRPRSSSTLGAARGTDDDERAPATSLDTMPALFVRSTFVRRVFRRGVP
jgi:hypothetical protein